MDEKTTQFAEYLRQNPAVLQGLMRSPDGQALMQRLNGADGGAGFRQAMRSAAGGDPSDITARLRSLMESPDGAALLQRIQKAVQP
ncbi:MAG: hypothetical protein IJ713_02980 [Oscillibacter sp.]|nr:hypothetical protein [Oscillibacter sp.]